MAFRAKYSSTCILCKDMIRPGEYKTWNRIHKGDYHLECWRKTPQYIEWKAKQAQNVSPSPSGYDKQSVQEQGEYQAPGPFQQLFDKEQSFDLPKEDMEEIFKETIELKEINVTKDSDNKTLDVLGQAIWARIEPKVSKLDGVRSDFEVFKLDVQETITTAIEKVKAELPKPTVVTIENKETGEVKDLGIQHKLFPRFLQMLGARDKDGYRLNYWLTGPAGSGKSKAPELAARALGWRYASTNSLVDTYKLTGHFSPGTGEYITTIMRDFWENGGMMVWDDFDGSDPNAVIEMLPISNHIFPFPDAMVSRHQDFCLVLTANTWGQGGTSDYVGRMKQDAAFINRFVQFYWDIDEDLELATCPNQAWAKKVQAVRAKVKAQGIKIMITPRQSYQGAALLAAGIEQSTVEQIVLKQSMTSEQWESIQ